MGGVVLLAQRLSIITLIGAGQQQDGSEWNNVYYSFAEQRCRHAPYMYMHVPSIQREVERIWGRVGKIYVP